jgi:hypothetical protein
MRTLTAAALLGIILSVFSLLATVDTSPEAGNRTAAIERIVGR